MKFIKKSTKYRIGIFGSAISEKPEIIKKAQTLGRIIGKKEIIIITGACSGIPYQVAKTAFESGVDVWGYSPKLDLSGQKKFTPKDDLSIYKKIFFIPSNFSFKSDLLACKKYRNVISTANCEAGIIISGRWGTMNEFTNLYDMGKVIGVLTGTGGIADELPELNRKITKKSKAKVFFSDSSKKLVEILIKELELRNS